MKLSRFLFQKCLAAGLLFCQTQTWAADPGDYWLVRYGLHDYQWDWDHDQDGYTARAEYLFGTNPLSAVSAPPTLHPEQAVGTLSVSWPSKTGARYVVGQSANLLEWDSSGAVMNGTGATMMTSFSMGGSMKFYRLEALNPLDTDGDGLSAVEEGILGTNAGLADTDGDTLSDGVEVFQTFTNPLVANPLGGTIRGTVKTDPNGDGNAADGAAIQNTQVYLDADFDGEYDVGEPVAATNSSGVYEFTYLAPGVYHVRQVLTAGQVQTLPAPFASPVLNRLPDEVVNYTHGIGGSFPSAYGALADTTVVVPVNYFGSDVLVDPALTLKPIGRRGVMPPFGIWTYNEYLSIPQNGSILWRFDEKIVDRPGTDLVIHTITRGAGEQATLELGLTAGTLQNAGTITETVGGASTAIPIDLAALGITGAVQYVKITSLGSEGGSPGIEIVGAEAVNYVSPMAGALEVVVVASETHENNNFARHFRDDPPEVFLYVDGADFRAGQSAAVTVQAQDDITITSRALTANGASITLNGNGEGTVPLPTAGTFELRATATDSGGHTTVEETTIYVNNADGSSPFNANLTGASTAGSYEVEIVTPHSGAILSADTPVMARISGLLTPNWVLDYAPVNLINPYDMAAADPDWITLGSGSGFLANQSAGTQPVATLPNGIYFLRLAATPTTGGATVYHGQVFAKGVNAADIQPQVTITSPVQGSTAGLVTPIIGSITSTRPLVEWFAEYAPASSVDLNDLGSNEPPWIRFAQGTTTISNATIASFDTSLVPDGSYIVRIVAWNDIRLGWAEPLPIEVAGTAKLGRLRREFTDLALPVGGIPFVIRRVYDSLDAGRDQGLGFGWSLALLNPDIKETVADTGSGMFGNRPFHEGTRVYVNTPDGNRAGFTFHAEFGVGGLFGAIYKAEFIPDPGVYETLEVPEGDDPFLTIDGNGNAFVSFLGFAWNPSVYILTTKDGTRYTYDEDAGFVAAEDRNGNMLSITPDGLRHSGGAAVTFTRDGNNRITQINAPDGVTIQYGYNTAGDLETVTDDDGRVTEFSYYPTPAHFLKDVTDPLGRVGVTYEYDAAGKLVAIIDEDGERTEIGLNPGAFTGTVTDRRGNVTSYVYDARGNVTRETNALSQTTTYEYNDAANPDKQTKRTDALGNVETWQYDVRGNTTTMNRPNSFFAATYNTDGKLLTLRNFAGENSTYSYDSRGNLASRSEPGRAAETYNYTSEGMLATMTTPDAESGGVFTSNFGYDTQGRLASASNDHGYSAQLSVSAQGRLNSATLPGGRVFSFTYSADGSPAQETDPSGGIQTTATLPDGTKRVTDRLGRVTDYLVSADQNIEHVTLPGGVGITIARDEERNVTSLTDAAGNTTSWQYDALNRPTRQTDQTGAFSTWAYDAAGNITEIINRNGKRRTFTYDASNRLTHERWHDGTGAVIRDFAYSYQFNEAIAQITDGAATWDFLGPTERPGNVIVSYPGQTTRTISYAWDTTGAGGGGACCGGSGGEGGGSDGSVPAQITVSGGADFFRLTAEYVGGNLRRLLWSSPNNFFGPELQFHRDSNGRLDEIRRYHNGGGVRSRTGYTWDALGRLVNITHTDGAGIPLHADAPMTLVRDAESRVTSVTRASDTATYSYDVRDQLTGVAHTGGPAESYTYNTMGARTASHLIAGPYTIGTANRLMAAGTLSYTYDAEGNVTEKTDSSSGQVTRYTYDHRNQLVLATLHATAAAPANTTVVFEYDYAGRMMSRSLNGVKTWILNDRQMPLAEFADGSTAVNAAFLYDPARLDTFYGVWRSGADERLLLTDQLGTVQGATDAVTGALVWWASYDAFGNLNGAPPPGIDSLRFAGRFYNETLGLYEMRARFMDPRLGRFTQEDPSGLNGGDLNFYRYAGNNPLIQRDPTGLVSAIEYTMMTDKINDVATYCDFAKCVAGIWSSMTVSVLTLTPAKPSDDNCGLKLLPQPNFLKSPKSKLKSAVQNALKGTPAGLGFAAVLAMKACGEFVNELPGLPASQP